MGKKKKGVSHFVLMKQLEQKDAIIESLTDNKNRLDHENIELKQKIKELTEELTRKSV